MSPGGGNAAPGVPSIGGQASLEAPGAADDPDDEHRRTMLETAVAVRIP